MTESRDPVRFGVFDPDAEVQTSERNLPHWFQPGVATFITFRTADSMPREVLMWWKREQQDWIRRHHGSEVADMDAWIQSLPPAAQREFKRHRERCWHRHLDSCHGECFLRCPELGRIVADALQHFDGRRYDVDSFVVMPNHVHLLVQFRPPTTLRGQTKSWLRFTALEINARLGRTGHFWQSEPFDHLVRSAEQFEYLRRYIEENPAKASLRAGEFIYWSSPRVARESLACGVRKDAPGVGDVPAAERPSEGYSSRTQPQGDC